jgi:hypothetical protein
VPIAEVEFFNPKVWQASNNKNDLNLIPYNANE